MFSESFLSTIIYLLCVSVVPTWSLASCSHPASVPNAHVRLQPANINPDKYGRYPAGTQATIDCYNGFHLKYDELKYMLCNEAGEWISNMKFPIESVCQPDGDGCGPPPFLDHGRYVNERNRLKSAGRAAGSESYPLGAILKPTCDASFSLNCSSHQCGRIICEGDGNWSMKKGDFNARCFSVAEPLPSRSQNSGFDEDADLCGPPPDIQHGYYTFERNQFKQTSPASQGAKSYPIGTVLDPACEKSFSKNCSRLCGRIICEPNGWAPKDDKFITACVAEPLLVRSNLNQGSEAFCTNPPVIERATHDAPPEKSSFEVHTTIHYECLPGYIVRGIAHSKCFLLNSTARWFGPDITCEESHGSGSSESSTKHYLVLALAVLSIVGVCILTVVLLRRPTFCKKSRGPSSNADGRGGSDVPVIITSSSPASHLDSLPVAMNTGIFLPGQGYDLQDCHFQDAPICGTSVFK